MNTYYSIVFAQIRPSINEKVSVGLLLFNEKSAVFSFSKSKLNFLKKLIPENSITLLKEYIKGIEKSLSDHSKNIIKYQNSIFCIDHLNNTEFSKAYIDYLSNYSNNLVSFSTPAVIDIDVSNESFANLYRLFIEETVDIKHNLSIDLINTAKNTLIKKVSNYVNIDVSISSLEIPELKKPKLIFPKSIDIIGKNGKYFLGQFVDFNKKIDILRANISYDYNFVNELKDIQNSYLIGVQPDKDKATNNEYWDDVKDYPLIKLVPIDELSKLEDQIIENQVKPILS